MERALVFDQPHSTGYAEVRHSILAQALPTIWKQAPLRTALDVGCGVGYFSAALRDMGLQVTAIDGRPENVAEARRRVSGVRFHVCDVESSAVLELGQFDLSLCFGLLYHLENPFRAIRSLSALTSALAFIESMYSPDPTAVMRLVDEPSGEDQSLNCVAFYPSEAALVKMLYRSGFPFVYRLTRFPEHSEFSSTLWRKRRRTVLIASRFEIEVPGFEWVDEFVANPDLWASRWGKLRMRLARARRLVR